MQVLPFLAVAVVVVVTPGIDTALVTRNALLYGHRAAVATAVGVNVGIAFWTVAASIGLAAVVAASAEAFTAIKLAGGDSIGYVAVAHKNLFTGNVAAALRAAREGVLKGKPDLLLATSSRRGLALLGALFNLIGVVWLLSYAVAAARGRAVLSRPRVKRVLDRVSGMVLVGLGARLALEHRR